MIGRASAILLVGLLVRCPLADAGAIHDAAGRGDLARIDELRQQGDSVNARDGDGNTPLHWAARGEKATVATIRGLVERHAAVDVSNRDGLTPLMVAAASGDAGRVRALIAAGADIDRQRQRLGRELSWRWRHSGYETALMLAAGTGDAERVAALLDAGANVHCADIAGRTALHVAADRPDGRRMVRLLLAAEADSNVQSSRGVTPLMIATERGDPGTVELLIESGADPFLPDRDGTSALLRAVPARLESRDGARVWRSCVALLKVYRIWLEAEPEPSRARTPDGLDLLTTVAAGAGRLEEVIGLLDVDDAWASEVHESSITWWVAIRRDPDAPLILQTLVGAGADANAPGRHGEPPIVAATRYGRLENVRALIEAGAAPNNANPRGVTALMAAAAIADPAKIDVLLRARSRVGASTRDGRTALWFSCGATEHGLSAMQALVRAGASIQMRDKRGTTPLMVAASRLGDLERLQFLLDHGASLHDVNYEGLSVLAFAVGTGCPRAHINALIDAGALVGELESPRVTGLMVAASLDDVGAVTHLLDRGANAMVESGERRTALHFALDPYYRFVGLQMVSRDRGLSLLEDRDHATAWWEEAVSPHPGVKRIAKRTVVKSMIAAGANLDAADWRGVTPLMLAAQYADTVLVEDLLAAGANRLAVDKDGHTAIDYARRRSRMAERDTVVRLLASDAQSDG